MELYELIGADGLLFSPYCWRSRLALAHKGLEPERVGCRFTDKALIAFSGQEKVPVLQDGDTTVADSWSIAGYLEDRYPDRPPLFGDSQARTLAHFVNSWADTQLNAVLFPALANDIYRCVDPADRDYFRTSREKRLGKPLEVVAEEAPHYRKMAHAVLTPFRQMLAHRPYLCGDTPGYADHIVMGSLQWARVVSHEDVLREDDPIREWRARMLADYPVLTQTSD